MSTFSFVGGSDTPFQYLINVFNLLPPKKQLSSLEGIEKFFAEKSYFNETYKLTTIGKRFVRDDIPTLLSMIEKLGCMIDSCRLLANVSKVAGMTFEQTKARHVYQAEVQIEDQSYWGWVPAAWVDTSEYLKENVDPDTQTLRCEELTPTLLFALECVHESQLVENKSVQIQLSVHTFAKVWDFAKKTDSTALRNQLYEIYSCLDGDALLQLRSVDSSIRCPEGYVCEKKFRASFSSSEDETPDSVWFNKKEPYRSISRFVQFGRALPISEQQGILSAIRDFFTSAASQRKEIRLDDEEKKNRFARIELPFLIEAMHFSPQMEPSELIRFVTNVQLVTRLFFSALPIIRGGAVLVFETKYGSNPLQKTFFGLSLNTKKHKPPGQIPLETVRFQATKPVILSRNKVVSVEVICRLIDLALKEDSPVTWELAMEHMYACMKQEKKWKKLSTWIAGQLSNPLLIDKLKVMNLVSFLKPDYSKIDEEIAAHFALLNIACRAKIEDAERATFHALEDLFSETSLDIEGVLTRLKKLNKDEEIAACLNNYPSIVLERAVACLGFNTSFAHFCLQCEQAKFDLKEGEHLKDPVQIFNALSNKKIVSFAKLAGQLDILERAKEGIASVSPAILFSGLKELLENTLAFEKEQIESIYSAFVSIIPLHAREERPELSDHQKKQLLSFFKSDACTMWIERESCLKLKRQAVIEDFKNVYKVHETISIKDRIKASHLPLSEKVADFLCELVEDKMNVFIDRPIYRLLYKHKLQLEERRELLEILRSKVAKNWFHKVQSFHEKLTSFVESLTTVPDWLDAFKAAHIPQHFSTEETTLFIEVLLLAWQFSEVEIYFASRKLLPQDMDELYEKTHRQYKDPQSALIHHRSSLLSDAGRYFVSKNPLPQHIDELYERIYKQYREPSVESALNHYRPGLHGQVCAAVKACHCRVEDRISIDFFVNSDRVKEICPSQSTREALIRFLGKSILADSFWLGCIRKDVQQAVNKNTLSKREVNQMREALKCSGGPTDIKQRLISAIPVYW